MLRIALSLIASIVVAATPLQAAHAWGDEGHKIVGEIALHYLTPEVKARVFAMLAADVDPLTSHDFPSETTWADKYRAASNANRAATHLWHFTDIEVSSPDIGAACFGFPTIPPGTPASAGPANDCAVNKVDQFAAELAAPSTSATERLRALKSLLHFVGDLHQPLHSADRHDAGGNAEMVSATKLGSGKLHAFWDTQFVQLLGTDPIAVGDALAMKITASDVATWTEGTPSDWAMEAFSIARDRVYGKLPKPKVSGSYVLSATYVKASTPVVTLQLSRAGVRLAYLLNEAFASS